MGVYFLVSPRSDLTWTIPYKMFVGPCSALFRWQHTKKIKVGQGRLKLMIQKAWVAVE